MQLCHILAIRPKSRRGCHHGNIGHRSLEASFKPFAVAPIETNWSMSVVTAS